MRIFGRIVVVIVALGGVALAYAYTSRSHAALPIPPSGSYRVTDIDEGIAGGKLLETPGGKIAIIEVDYQGPREWAEFVIENWDGPALVDTETIMHAKFGSDMLVRHDWGTQAAEGPPFAHQREIYSIWLDRLPEVLADGRNAIGKVLVADPNEPDCATDHGALLHVRSYDKPDPYSSGFNPRLPRSGGSKTLTPDSQPLLIWERRAYSKTGVSGRGEPPYPEGVRVSRMLFRLVEK